MTSLYIGLMSGTSLDGVDGVIVAFDAAAGLQVRSHAHRPFTAQLRHSLQSLNLEGPNELHRAALAGNAVAQVYATTVEALLTSSGLSGSDIVAVGAHGQTVRHQPGAHDGVGYTLQLNNAALLAERCGIDVVADLRSRDVAAGGQGAPLVPAFHKAVFGRSDATVAVLNIGGIANLTVLDPSAPTVGFDCGPGNALMDEWIERHTGRNFDADGAWAASGTVQPALLGALLADDYFGKDLPKSTGRHHFNMAWLQGIIGRDGASAASAGTPLAPADVQATLAELTARSSADSVRRHAPTATELLVCGGGALNGHLMRRLADLLPQVQVRDSAECGLPASQVEAAAFAWLAREFTERRPGNLPEVTGALGPRVLGALWPA